MSALSGAKRKIGGHFGAAVGAASKKGRGWRDEVDDEEPLVAADESAKADDEVGTAKAGSKAGAKVAADSESEVDMDPGTPLPSEDEEERTAAAAAGTAPAAAEPSAAAAPEEGAGEAPAPAGEGQLAADVAAADVAATVPPVVEQAPSAASGPAAPAPGAEVVVSLELVVAGCPRGLLRVLLRGGLDQALERRLAACLPPDGGPLNSITEDLLCTFGAQPPASAKPSEAAAPEAAAEKPEATAAAASSSSSAVPAAACGESLRAGVLCMALHGDGLALTLLGAEAAPVGRGHYAVAGMVLQGRGTLRKLAALAPLTVGGESKTAQPAVLRVAPAVDKAAGLGAGIAEAAATAVATSGPRASSVAMQGAGENAVVVPHPLLLLTRPPASALSGRAGLCFVLEADPTAEAVAAEDLEVAELELDCREIEVDALKHMTFCRERQTGVDKVEERLSALEERLKALGGGAEATAPSASPEDVGGGGSLGEALSGQRWWQEQRLQRLLRVLRKLH